MHRQAAIGPSCCPTVSTAGAHGQKGGAGGQRAEEGCPRTPETPNSRPHLHDLVQPLPGHSLVPCPWVPGFGGGVPPDQLLDRSRHAGHAAQRLVEGCKLLDMERIELAGCRREGDGRERKRSFQCREGNYATQRFAGGGCELQSCTWRGWNSPLAGGGGEEGTESHKRVEWNGCNGQPGVR